MSNEMRDWLGDEVKELRAELKQARQERDEVRDSLLAEIKRLDKECGALRAMLKRIEWNVSSDWRFATYCQVCGAHREDGHKPDCELAKMLKENVFTCELPKEE